MEKSPEDSGRLRLVSLLQEVAAGDRAAFQELYKSTSAKLYGTVIRILSSRDLANDVIQEVYIKIWEKAGDFNPAIASPITWMATIARNRALDEIRRKVPESIEDHQEVMDSLASTIDPLAAKARGEELRRLLNCLGALDEERRQMVLLAYYRGWTRDALSQKFGRPVSTVKSLLYRGLAQLRECLAHD